jgi:hypothetical protein
MTTGVYPVYPAIAPRQNVVAGLTARMIRDLDHCEYKKRYACGLVECMTASVCEFSIDCGEAGSFCRHPSVKYTEKMLQALLEFD